MKKCIHCKERNRKPGFLWCRPCIKWSREVVNLAHIEASEKPWYERKIYKGHD